MRAIILIIGLLSVVIMPPWLAAAEKNAGGNKAAVPEPPPMQEDAPPSGAEPDDGGLEPEITITPRGDEIHEEYRINGRLYMVKIIPAKGPPYYLIDYEGNGRFRRSDLEPRIAIPMWVIKRF